MLGMANIRGSKVATIYFMFQLQPGGVVAHFQICGNDIVMNLAVPEDLTRSCQGGPAIAPKGASESAQTASSRGKKSNGLGACSNGAHGADRQGLLRDLTVDAFRAMIDDMAAGQVPVPGAARTGGYASEPLSGLSAA